MNTTGDAVAAITAFNLTSNNMSIGHYEAYGNALATAYASNPYGYRGYYTDSETGFAYLNARYYDPATQRFTQEDTYWGDNLQRNLYAYCSGNPVMYTDPSGHYKQVQQGSKGDDVRTLQKLLNAHGAKLAVDGDFGPMTKAAVVAYQKAAGNFAVDGIAGKNTWESLLANSPSKDGSSNSKPFQRTAKGPGTMFDSIDEAAIDFTLINNPLTHGDNRERGTYIFKVITNDEVKYTYFNSPPGAHNNVIFNGIVQYRPQIMIKVKDRNIKDVDSIGIGLPAAFVHTHPYCHVHEGEKYSDLDKLLIFLPGITAVYLGSPQGKLYKYDKSKKDPRPISSSMPKTNYEFPECKPVKRVTNISW